jgi:prepilin-type processing-associated H-X9-DG protein
LSDSGFLRNTAFASEHPGGVNFVFVDGHVRFISENVDTLSYKAAGTISGNENYPAL